MFGEDTRCPDCGSTVRLAGLRAHRRSELCVRHRERARLRKAGYFTVDKGVAAVLLAAGVAAEERDTGYRRSNGQSGPYRHVQYWCRSRAEALVGICAFMNAPDSSPEEVAEVLRYVCESPCMMTTIELSWDPSPFVFRQLMLGWHAVRPSCVHAVLGVCRGGCRVLGKKEQEE